jgi:8-oxo-dGDP phosphatase
VTAAEGLHEYEVVESTVQYRGPIFTIRTDKVTMPGGTVAQRDYIDHVGAVGAVAVDPAGRVLLLRQYRHPVRQRLWELPAGLSDVDGEAAVETARRELYEEAGLRAATWRRLTDTLTSPGMTNERMRLFLAQDLTEVPDGERFEREHEEAELETAWFTLDEAVRMVFDGQIRNATCVIGVLATARAAEMGWERLPAT